MTSPVNLNSSIAKVVSDMVDSQRVHRLPTNGGSEAVGDATTQTPNLRLLRNWRSDCLEQISPRGRCAEFVFASKDLMP